MSLVSKHRKNSQGLPGRERLRASYRPARVRILFIGEAPPASGAFFYKADSGLYRAIQKAFAKAFPAIQDNEFLPAFRDLGCYLVDLCGRPVDRLEPPKRRAVRRLSEPRLTKLLHILDPSAIVVLLRSIEPKVLRAERAAGWNGPQIVVLYPGRWIRHRKLFEQRVVPALRKWNKDPGISSLRKR